MSWYDLDSNVARVSTNKARIYSIKQCLSRFEHDLQTDFHTIVLRFQVRSSSICYGLVRLNTTFTRFTGHLQGLYTVPSTFVPYDLYTILTRLSLLVLCASCTVSYRLTRSLTVLYDRLNDIYTRTSHPCQFFKSFKNHTRLTRIHSNGPSVSRIKPRFIRLYVRFTRVANRVNRVFCVRRT